LLSELPFASLLVYAPQGTSTTAQRSREVRAAIKRGDKTVLELACERLRQCTTEWVGSFFHPRVLLVPVPGSSPLHDPKSLWVARDICRRIVERGLATATQTLLRRARAVPKSAFALPSERPTATRHFDSFTVDRSLYAPTHVTLVDDVITRGSTLLAAASRLQVAFPECEVRAFALLRTMTRTAIDTILEPCFGTIAYTESSDSTRRSP
jgi:hypothetical protein